MMMGTTSGTLACSSSTSSNGVATFAGCRIDKVGVGDTLIATATGLTSATSALFDVADRLVFTTQPAGAGGGIAFTTQPVVAVRAGATATATHDTKTPVTISIRPGTGATGAILTCTGGLSRTVVAGVASFAGCAIDKASPTSPANPYVLVASATGSESILDYRGLVRRQPFAALAFVVFLLSLTGLPPFAGFIGKWYLFTAVWARTDGAGGGWYAVLLVIAALNTAVSLYYYARIIRAMFLDAPAVPDPAPLRPAPAYELLAGVFALAVLVSGILPQPVISAAQRALDMLGV